MVVQIPAVNFWTNQEKFSQIILVISSILFTSTIAYVASELINAKIISKLKLFFNSKWLFIRIIISTSVASIVDTTFMLPIIITNSPTKVAVIFFSLILMKLIYSLILIPVFWLLVEFLKKKEPVLANDSFVPFSSVNYTENANVHYLGVTD